MNPVIPKITIWVTLTKAQINLIKKEITEKGNAQKACTYAAVHFTTFKKALSGGRLRKEQREKLVEFCALVKQQEAA